MSHVFEEVHTQNIALKNMLEDLLVWFIFLANKLDQTELKFIAPVLQYLIEC